MASGDTLTVFMPLHSEPPASNYATLDVRGAHAVLDFDASTDETAYFGGVLPGHYAGNGITVTLIWAASSATSGDCVWDVAFERHVDDVTDIDATSFAAVQSATATAASASGETSYDDIAFTDGAQIDSLAIHESFRLSVTRDANNGSDTMTGDAELLRVIIKET